MAEERIAPGDRGRIGVVNAVTARVIGVATGGGAPNLFTTLARHRRLYRRWLWFASGLMPGGRLPRRDAELVILRVAHRTGCVYEQRHHEYLGRAAGLDAGDLAAVGTDVPASWWSARQRALVDATDELLADHGWSEPTWQVLRAELDELELIELPMLVGHYQMLASTIGALGIRPDPVPSPGPVRRVVTGWLLRRRGGGTTEDARPRCR
ncbi:carboxymuconolactone decarboxylase family protein [Nitriliruptoraceae bacterium ZYF776]|nr:carboxymuconolactone decarboxylase family protein [Profundirhabdus halotolerans]